MSQPSLFRFQCSMHVHLRNARSVHSQINVTNADNTGGHVIGQLYRHTNTTLTFVIASLVKVESRPGIGDCVWWYEVLQEGAIKGVRKKDLELALELGKIELVK